MMKNIKHVLNKYINLSHEFSHTVIDNYDKSIQAYIQTFRANKEKAF